MLWPVLRDMEWPSIILPRSEEIDFVVRAAMRRERSASKDGRREMLRLDRLGSDSQGNAWSCLSKIKMVWLVPSASNGTPEWYVWSESIVSTTSC